jgi:hypothetical protein
MIEGKTTKNETAVNISEQVSKRKRNATREKHNFCKDCRWYDKSSEREFHRKVGKKDESGKRTEIVELRAVCKNPEALSYRHLVMAQYSKRQCRAWEQGASNSPQRETVQRR